MIFFSKNLGPTSRFQGETQLGTRDTLDDTPREREREKRKKLSESKGCIARKSTNEPQGELGDETRDVKILIRHRQRRVPTSRREFTRQRDGGVLPSSSLSSALETLVYVPNSLSPFTRHRTELPLTADREGPATVAQKESDGEELRRRRLQTRSTDGCCVVGSPKRTCLLVPWREGRRGDSGGHGRGASEPHGRTDGRPWPIVLRSHEFQGRLR